MKLFGRKAAPAEARAPLSRYGGGGGAIGDWPRSYEAQVRAGYVDNAVAQRAVRLVAESVADAPLAASSPALAALAGPRLLEAVATYLLLHGNAFLQVLDDGAGGVGELFALRPERVGNARWRLTGLWRGRRGSDWAIGGQAAGDRFVLLAADAVAAIDLPVAAIGSTVRVLASGIGDTAGPIAAACAVAGESVRPPRPVRLRLASVDGAPAVAWARRSRAGFRWIDGGDVPLAEESEAYRVTIAPPGGVPREVTVGEPRCALDAGEAVAGTVVTVRQVGTLAESLPATLVV